MAAAGLAIECPTVIFLGRAGINHRKVRIVQPGGDMLLCCQPVALHAGGEGCALKLHCIHVLGGAAVFHPLVPAAAQDVHVIAAQILKHPEHAACRAPGVHAHCHR